MSPSPSRILNAFTVDVEDYFQVSGFERQVTRESWDGYESRVVGNTHSILDLLASTGTSATFFVLGWVADRFPELVRQIREQGHELGSHSYWHRLVYSMTRKEFRADLRRSKSAIEDAAGVEVKLFRAPSFSITARSLWALEILAEEGFSIDSSVFPVRHDRYGIPGGKPEIHTIETSAGPLVEYPMAIVRAARFDLPVGGGGYFRLYPYGVTKRMLRSVNRKVSRPFSFYVHPWEVDPLQPRIRQGTFQTRFRHYVNLRSTHAKLTRLLHDFRFGTMSQSIREFQASPACLLQSNVNSAV